MMDDSRYLPGEGEPRFILVNPQMGENIGAAARAMWNFGLSRLCLVEPRDGWPNPRAVAMASGAGRVLEQAQITQTTQDALADCTHVFATTARPRDLTKCALPPAEAMAEAHEIISEGGRVGILFGAERAGLENCDISRAQAIISIPVNPDFASLNLAQAVLLVAYEWRKGQGSKAAERQNVTKSGLAEFVEVEKLFEHLVADLNEARFFWPKEKADGMQINLRNMLSRFPLTPADVQILHGIIRALGTQRRHD